MHKKRTKNTAIPSYTGYDYQILVGLQACFLLLEDQFICIEHDGDISIIAPEPMHSKQIEVKHHQNQKHLTDQDKNFWKTLKNWLSPDFDHTQYGELILHTTQSFGRNTVLKEWHLLNVDKRLQLLRDIIDNHRRNNDKIDQETAEMQDSILSCEIIKLKAILKKIKLLTGQDQESALKKNIKDIYLKGIPVNNKNQCLQELLSFIRDQREYGWRITYQDFSTKCENITNTYRKKKYDFPDFKGRKASTEEVKEYENELFVQKIMDIEHYDEISEAIGNWIELFNLIYKEFDKSSSQLEYKNETDIYQEKLINYYKKLHETALLNAELNKHNIEKHDIINNSKIFYNGITTSTPIPMNSNFSPQTEFRNGLLHESMNNEEYGLKWKISYE